MKNPLFSPMNTNNWRPNLKYSKEMESATNTFDNNNANTQAYSDMNLSIARLLIKKSNECNYQLPEESLNSGFRNSVIQ